MGVEVVAHVLEVVVHVLAGVDLVVLPLAVGDVEQFALSMLSMLSEEGRDQRAVSLSVVGQEEVLVEDSAAEERQAPPSDGHFLEVGHTHDGLQAQVHSTPEGKALVPLKTFVEALQLDSLLNGHVVGKEVGDGFPIVVHVVVLEAVFLDPEFAEPGPSGDFASPAEVSEWGDFI